MDGESVDTFDQIYIQWKLSSQLFVFSASGCLSIYTVFTGLFGDVLVRI